MNKTSNKTRKNALLMISVFIGILAGALVFSCTHEDEVLITKGPNITRGDHRYIYDPLNPATLSFDKTHCNVNWSTAYQGALGLLTGRFDTFGITRFVFVENNPDSISFEFWVWVNSVNTSEPGRDHGCLAGKNKSTFGVTQAMTTEDANVAILKSKSVTYSTTDNGYIVKCDLTFHDTTGNSTGTRFVHEIIGKLKFDGVVVTLPVPPATVTKEAIGFSLDFPMLAKTDFGIVSTSIADQVNIDCNVVFRRSY